jgi:hypothetical protein
LNLLFFRLFGLAALAQNHYRKPIRAPEAGSALAPKNMSTFLSRFQNFVFLLPSFLIPLSFLLFSLPVYISPHLLFSLVSLSSTLVSVCIYYISLNVCSCCKLFLAFLSFFSSFSIPNSLFSCLSAPVLAHSPTEDTSTVWRICGQTDRQTDGHRRLGREGERPTERDMEAGGRYSSAPTVIGRASRALEMHRRYQLFHSYSECPYRRLLRG